MEAELAGMTPGRSLSEFLEDLSLEEGAKERIIKRSFGLLNLIGVLHGRRTGSSGLESCKRKNRGQGGGKVYIPTWNEGLSVLK